MSVVCLGAIELHYILGRDMLDLEDKVLAVQLGSLFVRCRRECFDPYNLAWFEQSDRLLLVSFIDINNFGVVRRVFFDLIQHLAHDLRLIILENISDFAVVVESQVLLV